MVKKNTLASIISPICMLIKMSSFHNDFFTTQSILQLHFCSITQHGNRLPSAVILDAKKRQLSSIKPKSVIRPRHIRGLVIRIGSFMDTSIRGARALSPLHNDNHLPTNPHEYPCNLQKHLKDVLKCAIIGNRHYHDSRQKVWRCKGVTKTFAKTRL